MTSSSHGVASDEGKAKGSYRSQEGTLQASFEAVADSKRRMNTVWRRLQSIVRVPRCCCEDRRVFLLRPSPPTVSLLCEWFIAMTRFKAAKHDARCIIDLDPASSLPAARYGACCEEQSRRADSAIWMVSSLAMTGSGSPQVQQRFWISACALRSVQEGSIGSSIDPSFATPNLVRAGLARTLWPPPAYECK